MSVIPPTVTGTPATPAVIGGIIVPTASEVNSALAILAGYVDEANATITAQAATISTLQSQDEQRYLELCRKIRRTGVY